VLVDDHLRSVSHPDVHAVGDAAALRHPNGQELRMACATGLPSAQHLARVLAEKRAGPLRFRYFNQCVSLGRRDGLIQFVRADDSPVERVLTGRAAALYKEAIVRGTVIFERHPAVLTT
ncbi:MAG: oxidoreductase, partial [Kibdelosporangium sp.]